MKTCLVGDRESHATRSVCRALIFPWIRPVCSGENKKICLAGHSEPHVTHWVYKALRFPQIRFALRMRTRKKKWQWTYMGKKLQRDIGLKGEDVIDKYPENLSLHIFSWAVTGQNRSMLSSPWHAQKIADPLLKASANGWMDGTGVEKGLTVSPDSAACSSHR